MASNAIPAADDLVQARRKEGFGPVMMFVANLSRPDQLVDVGDVVMMRFREAVERDDFEPVGFEQVTVDHFEGDQP